MIFSLVFLLNNSCKKEDDKRLPNVITTEITKITASAVISGGNVKDDGGSAILERGICYGTISGPTIANNKTIAFGTTGIFKSIITGLTFGTTYYIRAYATNSIGTSYGNEISFTTLFDTPTLNTTIATPLTTTTALSEGTIISDGGSAIIERGICFSTSMDPTIANSKVIATTLTEVFKCKLSGLSLGTTYYARAYATNSVGTSYGYSLKFSTYALMDVDSNYYNIVTIGSQTWLKENLKTTKFQDGSDIPNSIDGATWINQTSGAYCWFNNNINNKPNYGALYNWYAVVDSRNLCPSGWHIPTESEWKILGVYLGIPQVQINDAGWLGSDQGTQMKSTSGWLYNGNGTNTSGFSALPGGFRWEKTADFFYEGYQALWWSNNEYDDLNAWFWGLANNNEKLAHGYNKKNSGYSVRCIRD